MSPEERERKLISISLHEVAEAHEWLRECFRAELLDRLSPTLQDYPQYENIYHCALLLHLVGDLTDLPLLFSAKRSGNMDLGCCFDWQFLFLSDPQTLIEYARSIDRPDIEAWVKELASKYNPSEMKSWVQDTIDYHRPA